MIRKCRIKWAVRLHLDVPLKPLRKLAVRQVRTRRFGVLPVKPNVGVVVFEGRPTRKACRKIGEGMPCLNSYCCRSARFCHPPGTDERRRRRTFLRSNCTTSVNRQCPNCTQPA